MIAAASSITTGSLLFTALNTAAERRRPGELQPHYWAKLLPPDQFSFPSGRSITAFAVAVPSGHYYAGATAALVLSAFNIAVSRIVLGMHFLTDVLAGILIGSGLGYAAIWAVTAASGT